jgi:hypothetical protein
MVRKMIILLALLMIIPVSGAYCAADLFNVTQDDGYAVRIDSDGKYMGMRRDVEVATTSDTITAAESGKVFLVDPATTAVTFTLPTAATGMQYTFTAIDGSRQENLQSIILDPASTDTLVSCVTSDSTTSFAAGDKIYSQGITGDSVTIVCGSANTWACINRVGSWYDGN